MRQGVWCLLPVALNAVPIHTQCSDHYLGEEASWLALSSHSAPINHTHTRTNSSSHETHGNQRFLRATSPGLCSIVFFWTSCLRVRASAPQRWTRFAVLVTRPLPWWAEGWLGIGSWDEGEGCREVYFTRSLYWDSAVRTRSSVTFVLYRVTCEPNP
jgi:hypothetical protein